MDPIMEEIELGERVHQALEELRRQREVALSLIAWGLREVATKLERSASSIEERLLSADFDRLAEEIEKEMRDGR